MTSDLLDPAHYMHLPICGFCMNAWDIIYLRIPGNRTTSISPMRWVEYCKVGGCDPNVWNYIDEVTGWPLGFPMVKGEHRPNWNRVDDLYEVPETDERVYHMRSTDALAAPWRKYGHRLLDQYCRRRDDRYVKVTDKHGNVLSAVVPDDEIKWDDDDDAEPEMAVEEEVEEEDDEDIW